jgi:hypothetical protein
MQVNFDEDGSLWNYALQQSEYYADVAWCHRNNARRLSIISRATSMPLAALAAVTGGTSLVSLGGHGEGSKLQLAIQIMTIVQAVLLAVIGGLDLQKRHSEHLVSHDAFNRLSHQMKSEMIKSPMDRLPIEVLLENSWSIGDDIQQKAPLISDTVYNQFKTKFGRECSCPQLLELRKTLLQKRNSGSIGSTVSSQSPTNTAVL